MPYDGLVRTNEKVYDLLCLGKSLQQSIEGDLKSFTLQYIDWERPERNVYHVTLCQSKLERSIGDVDLSIDLFPLLSLSQRNFMVEFTIEDVGGRPMGALTFDGELNYAVARRLERNIEIQTQVHPISLVQSGAYLTAGDMAQLILAWRIINRRIFIESAPGMTEGL